jgi:tetratricopeptide (TPR) repeat protein
MTADQTDDNAQVVSGQFPMKGRRRMLMLAVVLLLLIVGGSVWLWKIHDANAKKAAAAADNQAYMSLQKEAAYNSPSTPSAYAQLANAWMNYAQHTANRSHKITAYQQAGAAYLNANEATQALKALLAVKGLTGITYGEANNLAVVEAQLGNKPEAIYYFQQALKLIPTKNFPDASAQRQLFNQEIAGLKAAEK